MTVWKPDIKLYYDDDYDDDDDDDKIFHSAFYLRYNLLFLLTDTSIYLISYQP